MKKDKILEMLDELGRMLNVKFGTESYEIRCYLHDIKDFVKKEDLTNLCRCTGAKKQEEILHQRSTDELILNICACSRHIFEFRKCMRFRYLKFCPNHFVLSFFPL